MVSPMRPSTDAKKGWLPRSMKKDIGERRSATSTSGNAEIAFAAVDPPAVNIMSASGARVVRSRRSTELRVRRAPLTVVSTTEPTSATSSVSAISSQPRLRHSERVRSQTSPITDTPRQLLPRRQHRPIASPCFRPQGFGQACPESRARTISPPGCHHTSPQSGSTRIARRHRRDSWWRSAPDGQMLVQKLTPGGGLVWT